MNVNSRPCRFCGAPLEVTFTDLGMSPLANAYLKAEQRSSMEPFYPLHAFVCGRCFLVQLEQFESPEHLFSDYAYFSSYSETWLEHVKAYALRMIERFHLTAESKIVEIASNDGYLLQYFAERSIQVLGIEPAHNVAQAAIQKGIPTRICFFGSEEAKKIAAEGWRADVLAGNNVLAHVPDLNDFVRGLKVVLSPTGVVTLEFPHLLSLMNNSQFDTIYHEHFSYFSFSTVEKVLARHHLTIFDVDLLSTHGGSLRVYAGHSEDRSKPILGSVTDLKGKERAAGLDEIETYRSFSRQVVETKMDFLEFLIHAKRAGKKVVGYGAPAKGNTLLNFCGVREDLVAYTVDRNPHKQGLYLPGSHIPIRSPAVIRGSRPDYVVILPWNLREEISRQMAFIREWGGKFVVPIPKVEVF